MFNLETWSPKILSVLRVVTALLFLEHGTQKLFHFPAALTAPHGAAAVHATADHGASLVSILDKGAGPIELIGGLLLVVGLFSRVAAFICSGEMAFAYFLAHASRSVFPILNNGGEAILYCFVFFYLSFAGPGPFSIDALISKKYRPASD